MDDTVRRFRRWMPFGAAVALAVLTSLGSVGPSTSGVPPAGVQERPTQAPGDPDARLTDAPEAPDVDDCATEQHRLDERLQAGPSPYESARASFAIQFQDHVSPHRLSSAFVLPGETIEIEAVLTRGDEVFSARVRAGRLEAVDKGKWSWTAPERPGIYCLEVEDLVAGDSICLNGFVMVPYDGADVVNGYRIGKYERLPLRDDPAYRMPRGLIEVTPENEDTWVSPHFQLRQFLCKQESGYPKYMVLQTRLLLKLEMLLEELQDTGVDADSFYVMSGYRTPHYNRMIGNRTRYSRHAYGDAADIFVDYDRNGWMDDLDGSGDVDREDARLIYDVVGTMVDDTWYAPFRGGMGLYGPKPHRGPFVHVDTRGKVARW